MSENEFQQLNADTGKKDPNGEKGIGTLFRNERKNKGLSYTQLSEITKIRPYTLEALENERWNDLPAPVFVIGFIRSYARALELDEGKIVARYQEAIPAEVFQPKPFVGPVSGRKTFIFILIFFLFITASAYYMWKASLTPEKFQVNSETSSPADDKKDIGSEDITVLPQETEPVMLKKQKESNVDPEDHSGREDFTFETVPNLFETETSENLSTEELEPFTPLEQGLSLESETNAEDERLTLSQPFPNNVTGPELILRAKIRERTYIRILVDDRSPKEYVFRPGSSLEWRAKKGFELLIGNAGGVDLEFDGEKVGKLGRPGQVVRLKFPEKYERREALE